MHLYYIFYPLVTLSQQNPATTIQKKGELSIREPIVDVYM